MSPQGNELVKAIVTVVVEQAQKDAQVVEDNLRVKVKYADDGKTVWHSKLDTLAEVTKYVFDTIMTPEYADLKPKLTEMRKATTCFDVDFSSYLRACILRGMAVPKSTCPCSSDALTSKQGKGPLQGGA